MSGDGGGLNADEEQTEKNEMIKNNKYIHIYMCIYIYYICVRRLFNILCSRPYSAPLSSISISSPRPALYPTIDRRRSGGRKNIGSNSSE